jgi:hypothetical protein
MTELIRCMRDEDSVMTQTMRAWRKANAYVRSGQHAKAIYWLSRTVEILENGRPRPSRLKKYRRRRFANGSILVLGAVLDG